MCQAASSSLLSFLTAFHIYAAFPYILFPIPAVAAKGSVFLNQILSCWGCKEV